MKSVIIEEEEDASQFDEFIADYEKKKKEAEDNVMTEIKLHELEKKELEEDIRNLMRERDSNSPQNSSKSSSLNRISKRKNRSKSK